MQSSSLLEAPEAAAVLTKALTRSAELLSISQQTLAKTIGVSDVTIWRITSGARTVQPSSKEGELALLVVRLYRSLDAIVGGNDQQRIAWMTAHNRALNARPVDLVVTAEGLARTVAYLDSARATL